MAVGRLSHSTRLTLSSGRQFAPSWTVCTKPPVQSDYHAFKATVLLIPTSKTQRIATGGTGNRFTERRWLTQSSWKRKLQIHTGRTDLVTRSVKASYHGSKERQSRNSRKPPAKAVFFVWPLRYDRQSSASRNRCV